MFSNAFKKIKGSLYHLMKHSLWGYVIVTQILPLILLPAVPFPALPWYIMGEIVGGLIISYAWWRHR